MSPNQLIFAADPNIEHTLDATALRCPLPLLKARQQIRAMQGGALLLVLADDPGAQRDIPAWLRQTGHQLVQSDEQEGVYRFLIRVEGAVQ
jgi:TusA-related sulfurtransferase